jgi:CheY-like chemotaxis protein
MSEIVLFIDDEPDFMLPFVLELRDSGYEVRCCETVEELFEVMNPSSPLPEGTAELQHVDCVVLDIMMAHGSLPREKTRQGLRTGVVLYEILRERWPEVPVVVHTNLKTPEATGIPDCPSERCIFLGKRGSLPMDLVRTVGEAIAEHSRLIRRTT